MKTTTTVALLAILAAIALYNLAPSNRFPSTRDLYEEWKSQHFMFMRISPEHDQYRFKIFEQNLKEINEHNSKPGQTYQAGVNQFSGLSKEEFKETYLS